MGSSSAATFLTGTGSTTSKFKGIATGTDLVCPDLSGLPVEATANPLNLVIGITSKAAEGMAVEDLPQVRCEEWKHCDDEDAACLALRESEQPLKEGFFTWTQVSTLDGENELPLNCLLPPGIVGKKTTWECRMTSAASKARWRLTPINQELFCNDVPEGNACYTEIGTPESPDFNVGQEATLPGGGQLDPGVVFTFSSPDGTLVFEPCHTGTFDAGDVSRPVACAPEAQAVDADNNPLFQVLVDCEEPGEGVTAGDPAGDTGLCLAFDAITGTPITTTEDTGFAINRIYPTRSKGQTDSDLNVGASILQGSLNMSNKSGTAVIPVVFLGAIDLDVREIATRYSDGSTVFEMVNGADSSSLDFKRTSISDVGGPDGSPDGIPDLEVKFLSGPAGTAGTFIDGVKNTLDACPGPKETITVGFRGKLKDTNGAPDDTFVWIASAKTVAFKCPGAPK